mmetsp:Transcript_17779/g.55529  ORF Transcript_17779/g.55529 Transcript_17779/m.55529 type:complete len:201 (+) Transcript_17779:849-1451(+)
MVWRRSQRRLEDCITDIVILKDIGSEARMSNGSRPDHVQPLLLILPHGVLEHAGQTGSATELLLDPRAGPFRLGRLQKKGFIIRRAARCGACMCMRGVHGVPHLRIHSSSSRTRHCAAARASAGFRWRLAVLQRFRHVLGLRSHANCDALALNLCHVVPNTGCARRVRHRVLVLAPRDRTYPRVLVGVAQGVLAQEWPVP